MIIACPEQANMIFCVSLAFHFTLGPNSQVLLLAHLLCIVSFAGLAPHFAMSLTDTNKIVSVAVVSVREKIETNDSKLVGCCFLITFFALGMD